MTDQNHTSWRNALTNITQLMEQQSVIDQLLRKAKLDKQLGSGEGSSSDTDILLAAKIVLEDTVQRICPWVRCPCSVLLIAIPCT